MTDFIEKFNHMEGTIEEKVAAINSEFLIPDITGREAVLREALEIVTNDRQASYGTPENNFGVIADLWTTYLDVPIRADDVAAMMILLKVARHKNARSMDNAVDIAGYAACMYEVDSR